MTTALGIKIPIRMGQQGYFEQTFSSIEEAKSNLYNLLLTRKGERVMQPEFGVDIYGQLFDQITPDIKDRIEQEITDAVEQWLPYISLENVEVDISSENIENNKFDIKVGFGMKRNLQEYDEIIITFVV